MSSVSNIIEMPIEDLDEGVFTIVCQTYGLSTQTKVLTIVTDLGIMNIGGSKGEIN
jgi:hypothetical protein